MVAAIGIGAGGIAGWKALQRTESRQLQFLANDPAVKRDTQHFRDRLTHGMTASQITGDYRMLNVALKAFGLEADLPNKAFIGKVLESDLSDPASLANRLGDKRYLKLARAFDLKAGGADADTLGSTIEAAFVRREYEARVGQSDQSLRLALNARRELQDMATRTSTSNTLWYEVLGNPPLRQVFAKAFGFPDSYGRLPVDRQLNEFQSASQRLLGSSDLRTIAAGDGIERLITAYLAKSQLATTPAQNRYGMALSLLTRR